MPKIITFNVPAAGHVNPTLPVIRELVRRGHQVIYYLTEPYRKAIESTGAEFRSYGSHVPPDYFESRGLNGSNPGNTARTLAETSIEMLPDLLKMVDHERPDVILYDSMCPWGWMVGKTEGIPYVSSMTLLLLSPADMMRAVGVLPILRMGVPMLPYIRKYQAAAQQLNKSYGLKLPAFADFLNLPGLVTVNYTSSMVQPNAHKLDPSIKFVGPSIEERPHDTDFPFDKLDGRSLIYISLGTVINQNTDFYRACFTAFGGSDAQVVMSVGKATNIDSLGTIPANFIVRNFVPQLEILQRAAVFVTHAGMNSVHEGLYYNVPLILVPQQMEQKIVALRIAELGAGIQLGTATPSPQALSGAAQRILTDGRYKEVATRLGDSLRSAGGHCRAADEIEGMLNG